MVHLQKESVSPCRGQPDPDQQMNGEVLKVICNTIQKSGANFLVFGVGRDSDFWYGNVDGKVLFLESLPEFLDFQTQRVKDVTRMVHYTTNILDYQTVLHDQAKLDEFFTRLPSEVLETPWDVILVDAPMGMERFGKPVAGHPGRMQSVNAALKLAHEGTIIFVDDYQRVVERASAESLLGHIEGPFVFNNGHHGQTAMFVVKPKS